MPTASCVRGAAPPTSFVTFTLSLTIFTVGDEGAVRSTCRLGEEEEQEEEKDEERWEFGWQQ